MARFLFAWELGGGLGHVTVIQPLAERLVGRGHQVWAALRDTSTWNVIFGGTGVRCVPAPAVVQKPKRPIRPTVTFAHILHVTGFAEAEPLAGVVAAWRGLFDLVQPDILIADHSPMALLAARCAGIRTIPMGIPFSIPVAGRACPDWRPSLGIDAEQLARDEDEVLARANECLASAGADSLGHIADLYGEPCDALLTTVRELDPWRMRHGAAYWGPIVHSNGGAPGWPAVSGPKVFAYLKPFAGFKNVLQVIRDCGVRCVAYIGGLPTAARAKLQSPNIHIADRPVNLTLAARGCDLGITLASHGATAALLLAGKPVLLFPQQLEQRLTAECVVRMGAGLAAKPSEPDHIRVRMDRLLQDPRFTQSATQFAARYAERDQHKALDQIAVFVEQQLRKEADRILKTPS